MSAFMPAAKRPAGASMNLAAVPLVDRATEDVAGEQVAGEEGLSVESGDSFCAGGSRQDDRPIRLACRWPAARSRAIAIKVAEESPTTDFCSGAVIAGTSLSRDNRHTRCHVSTSPSLDPRRTWHKVWPDEIPDTVP